MANNTDSDFIFGRLENELRQIEEQKRRNAQRVEESERNWLSQILLSIGKAFEFLSEMIEKIFGSRK